MDFITDLPQSKSFNAALVVVDRFSKMAHFIPCTKEITSEVTAGLVLRKVFRLHGFPNDIVSDRGPQFVACFWKCLLQLLKVQCKLSSGHHPQTDGQTERTIQTLEQYLRCFISYQQDDWVDLLPLVEFAYNNTVHASTGKTPFFVISGQHLRWTFEDRVEHFKNPAVEDHLVRLRRIQDELVHHLTHAKQSQKRAADRHRQEPPALHVGDRVWLLRRNIKTTRPCEKFDYKRLGSYKILTQVNDVAFRLQLPQSMRVHPVFHVSFLEPYHENHILDRQVLPPPPVEIDAVPEYKVEAVLDSRIVHNQLQYYVDWKGYSPADRTWEPAEHLTHTQDLVARFHCQYPHKPSPTELIATRGTRRRRGR